MRSPFTEQSVDTEQRSPISGAQPVAESSSSASAAKAERARMREEEGKTTVREARDTAGR
jgi:hypothetical protein